MSIAIAAPNFHGIGVATAMNAFAASLWAGVRSWRYEGGKRDLRLDLLRGFAAFAMIADHVGSTEHSWLAYLTGGNRFFVSAAEAFVFISGLVMGIVYERLNSKSGIRDTLLKLVKRVRVLYLATVSVGLGFVGVSIAARASWAPQIAAGDELTYVFEFLTLQRTSFLVDIPLLYVLLILLAAPALFLLSHGRPLIVLAASWGLWLAWQLSPGSVPIPPWAIEENTVFHASSWQVLFLTGLVIGWHRNDIERCLVRLPQGLLALLATLVVGGAAVIYLLHAFVLDAPQANSLAWALFFDKAAVPIGRLLVFAVFCGAGYILVSLAWRPIKLAFGWLLLPLGQNALTAYSLHVFVMLGATMILTEIYTGAHAFLLMTSAQALCVLLIWAIVVVEPKLRQRLSAAIKSLPERILVVHATPQRRQASVEAVRVIAARDAQLAASGGG